MYQGKTHIHIENSDGSPQVFNTTWQQVQGLLDRNPDLADELHITIGCSDADPVAQWSQEDLDEYYGYMKTADILVCYTLPQQNIKEYAPELKVIHFISSGVEHVTPFDWVPEGIAVINNRGVHLPKSGESFAMFLYMINAGIPRLAYSQKKGKWDRNFTSVIKGRTLVVVGVGHQGGEMARQAKRLGMYVIGVNDPVYDNEYCDEMLPVERMKEAFERADIVSLHVPLTDATRGMINKETLSWLPEHAGLINIARGPVVDEWALHEALSLGKLSGAISDVFCQEPLPKDHFFWDTPNLFILPHISSDDLINYIPRTLDLTIRNLRNMKEGRPLENQLDLAKGY